MLRHVDPVSVVFHRYGSIDADVYIDVGDEFGPIWISLVFLKHADHMVPAIDDAFIEQLVEARDVMDFALNNFGSGVVVDIQRFVHIFNRTDVGVGIV
jgi:hypothetical protein